jgi:hypothetical protein
MPIVSTYSTVLAPNTTLSTWYSDIDDLLNALPDNNTNSIQAINVRDAVYTLYEYTNLVVASQSSTASVQYIRNIPSTYVGNVGGVNQGSIFPGDIQDVLDRIFYPYVSPSGSFLPLQVREFGFSTQVTLNWSVVRNSNQITLISVASNPIVPTGNSQSGVYTFNGGTHSLTPSATEVNTFFISVSDGTSTTTSSVDLNWMNRIFWGSIDLSSIGNPNLTFFPGSASQVATLCTDSVIYNLTGAGANGTPLGSQLSTTKNKIYNNIDGSSNYLIFAWPSSVPGAFDPNFNVNGVQSTSFTRVRTNSPFTNQWGFSGSNYEVWVSNTRQFSPLNIIIS